MAGEGMFYSVRFKTLWCTCWYFPLSITYICIPCTILFNMCVVYIGLVHTRWNVYLHCCVVFALLVCKFPVIHWIVKHVQRSIFMSHHVLFPWKFFRMMCVVAVLISNICCHTCICIALSISKCLKIVWEIKNWCTLLDCYNFCKITFFLKVFVLALIRKTATLLIWNLARVFVDGNGWMGFYQFRENESSQNNLKFRKFMK